MRDQFAASLFSLLLHALSLSALIWFGTQLQTPPVPLKLELTILPAPEVPPPPVEEPVPPVPAPPEPAPSAAPAAPLRQAKPVKPKPQTREVRPKPPKKTVKPEPRPKPAVARTPPPPVQKAVQPRKPRPQPEQAQNVRPAPQQRLAPRQTVRTVAQSADTGPDYSSLAGLSARPQTRSIRPSGAQGGTVPGRMSGQGQVSRATGRGSGTAKTGSGQGSGGVYSPGQIDGRLQVVKNNRPEYPASARQRNVEGWVRVRFVVNEQGRPEQIRIVAADPPNVFNASVQRAVSGWRFRPGTVQGRAVRVLVEQTIRFSLR